MFAEPSPTTVTLGSTSLELEATSGEAEAVSSCDAPCSGGLDSLGL